MIVIKVSFFFNLLNSLDRRHLFDRKYEWKERKIILNTNASSFPYDVRVDPLHMLLRVVSYMLTLQYAEFINENEAFAFESRIQSIKGMHYFKMRTPVNSDFQDDIDQKSAKIPYLNGNQCKILLTNSKKFISPNDPILLKIWKILEYLFLKWILVSSFNLAKRNMENCILAQQKLGFFLHLRFPSSRYGFYIHILVCHLDLILKNQNEMKKFSLQGHEASHSLANLYYETTNKDGGPEDSLSAFSQLYYKFMRRFYLSSQYDFPWIQENTHNEDDLIEDDLNFIKSLSDFNPMNYISEYQTQNIITINPSTISIMDTSSLNKALFK